MKNNRNKMQIKSIICKAAILVPLKFKKAKFKIKIKMNHLERKRLRA